MSLEDRIKQARLAQLQSERAKQEDQLRISEEQKTKQRQAWLNFEQTYQHQLAEIQKYTNVSGLSALLQEANKMLKGNIDSATLFLGEAKPFGYPLELARGNGVIHDDEYHLHVARELQVSSNPYTHTIPDLSEHHKIYQIRWNINDGAIALFGTPDIKSCDLINVLIKYNGTIQIQNYTIPKETWTDDSMLLEQYMADAILSPCWYREDLGRPPGSTSRN